MRTILFPTDFSMNSIHAIRYALNLFKEEREMNYLLVNAYTDPSAGASMSHIWSKHMQKVSQDMLEKLIQNIKENYGFPDFEAKLISQFGDLPGALWPLIKKHKVDLVVMGSSGATGPSPSLFGSNAFTTMKGVQCPVLTVPLQTSIQKPHRIGLASEAKMIGDETVLTPLNDLADVVNAWVMGIRVSKDARNRVISEIEEEFYEDVPELEYIDLNASDPVIGIETAIGDHSLDMIAVIMKRRSFFDRIFHKSVSKQIAAEIAIPMLALHEEELS